MHEGNLKMEAIRDGEKRAEHGIFGSWLQHLWVSHGQKVELMFESAPKRVSRFGASSYVALLPQEQ